MNPSGIVLMIAGVWVVSQVFAGNALGRLNILKPTAPTSGGGGLIPGLPDPGDLIPGGRAGLPNIDYGKLLPGSGGGGGL